METITFFTFMDFALNTAWGVVMGLFLLYFIDAICYGFARSCKLTTGLYIDQFLGQLLRAFYTALLGAVNHLWVWGVCNPTWFWNLLEAVLPSPSSKASYRYFQ
jgi:hypothetical protein